MSRRVPEMSVLQVKQLKAVGPWSALHRVGGAAGLCLQISPTGARSWILRIKVEGKRVERGLGSFEDVSLAAARDAARTMRAQVATGRPVPETRSERRARNVIALAASRTFDQCSKAFIVVKSPEWSNAKHAAQWTSTLATYASPAIGQMPVRMIDLVHIEDLLKTIWIEKTETATRVRARIEAVLDWAIAGKYRDGPNPARWKGNLDKRLPKPGRVSEVDHHKALPAADVAAFLQRLRKMEGQGARALEFAILTAARSGEVRGALWAEIDLDAAIWVIPGERMKMGREHRVPLSTVALKLLKSLSRDDGNELVFPAIRGGRLSDMTLSAVLKRMGVPAVPHGFRSTFRDWAAEQTDYPRDVAEMALAHAIGDKVEAAYRRGDLFDKRRGLMHDWGAFCDGSNETPA